MTDLFESLEPKRHRLHSQIADSIQELIVENHLAAGSQLPSERELAERLGVSRVTISQALHLLEQRGLVQIRAGAGTFITDKARSVFVDSMERLFRFSSCTTEDLMALREMLEPDIAAVAAKQVSAEDLSVIRRHLEQAEQGWYRGEVDQHVGADTAFHEALARATRNELVVAILAGVRKLYHSALRAQREAQLGTNEGESGILSHRPIYDALEAHNSERARAAMEEHMRLTRLAMEKAFGRSEGIDSVAVASEKRVRMASNELDTPHRTSSLDIVGHGVGDTTGVNGTDGD